MAERWGGPDRLNARDEECFYWATHGGAEIDLLVMSGNRRLGFEIKRTTAPGVTPAMVQAMADLSLTSLDVVHAGESTFPLTDSVRALSARHLESDLEPLRQP